MGKEGYAWGMCPVSDEVRQDTVFLKKQLFSSVSSLVSFEPIKVIKMEKAHSLGYHGRDTNFCSLSIVFEVFNQSHYPKYWMLNTVYQPVSPSRDDNAETAFIR